MQIFRPIEKGPFEHGERFLSEAYASGRYGSKESLRTYAQTYRLLEIYFPGKLLEEYTTEDLVQFITVGPDGRLRRDYMGGKTIQGYRNHVTQLVRWAKKQGIVDVAAIDTDALLEIKPNIRAKVRQGHWISSEEIPALLKAALSWVDPDVSLRNEMLLRLGLCTGLRAFELGQLQWNHVDFANGIVRVVKGKGGKDREVAYLEDLDAPLRAWKARATDALGGVPLRHFVLPPAGLVKSIAGKRGGSSLIWEGKLDPVILRTKGREIAESQRIGLSSDAVTNLVIKIAQRADSPVRAHDLRRSFAGTLENAGVPIQEISKQLGHESVDVTIKYLADNPAKRRKAVAGVKSLFG